MAIVAVVPAVEHLVGAWRAKYDAAAAVGVPAHITVLFPFLPSGRIDVVVEDVRRLCAARAPFQVEFSKCGRFPGGVLYLCPEPAAALSRLTSDVVARWPESPPYGGIHDVVIPHLTVANGVDETTMDEMEAELLSKLPVRAMVHELQLFSFDGVRWMPRHRLPLAARP